jgi:hypothetical protein
MAALLHVAPALADGDPASDVLLYEPAYLPLERPSPPVSSDLLRVLAESRRAGAPLKVAIIRERRDLGLDPKYYGRPQAYADFLAGELQAFGQLARRPALGRDPLLVIMPRGFGVHGLPPSARRALAGIAVPSDGSADHLTEAAGLAVQALAAQRGHPIARRFPRAGAGSEHTVVIVAVIGLVAAICAALAVALVRRSRR